MPSIVISYRRADTGQIAGRIFDRLEAHFGRDSVFMDIDGIPVGADFRERVQSVLDKCDIVLAVIGPHWADGAQSRDRLADEADWVRIEIETALAKKVPVVPVLIDQTQLPPASALPQSVRDIVFKQAARLDTGLDFTVHMERLLRSLDSYFESGAVKPEVGRPQARAREPERTSAPGKTVGPVDAAAMQTPPRTAKKFGNSISQSFSLSGRMSRRQWWNFSPAFVLFPLLLVLLFKHDAARIAPPFIFFLVDVALMWVAISSAVRRLHDLDLPAILGFVLVLVTAGAISLSMTTGDGGIMAAATLTALGAWTSGLVVFGFRKGSDGLNRFGPPPE